MHCKVTTVSECGRYARIIVTGWGDEVQEEIANAELTGEFCDKCTDSVNEDWLVGVDEICRENPATKHYC